MNLIIFFKTFLPDPTSRNRFIYCNNRQSIVGTCNPGQEFNPVESVCENASSNPREPCANRPDGVRKIFPLIFY